MGVAAGSTSMTSSAVLTEASVPSSRDTNSPQARAVELRVPLELNDVSGRRLVAAHAGARRQRHGDGEGDHHHSVHGTFLRTELVPGPPRRTRRSPFILPPPPPANLDSVAGVEVCDLLANGLRDRGRELEADATAKEFPAVRTGGRRRVRRRLQQALELGLAVLDRPQAPGHLRAAGRRSPDACPGADRRCARRAGRCPSRAQAKSPIVSAARARKPPTIIGSVVHAPSWRRLIVPGRPG